ncbi:hypothetical protein BJX63DRAFT_429917 [Aspergillus granulosus]|uniref:F-box domain protein n=1 Tax=Aspergillus granulosus TaxID=176169 RepID=A0ABR4HNZ1_9EURO
MHKYQGYIGQGRVEHRNAPRFKNLKSLALHRLHERSFGDVSDIAEILLASPRLEYLGLSCRYQAGLDNDLLFETIRYFHEKSQERGQLSTLQLCHLHLGIGTMPWAHPLHPEDHGYLSRLTDLTFLETLQLDNMRLSSDGPGMAVPFIPIMWELFSRATSLQEVDRELEKKRIVLVREIFECDLGLKSDRSRKVPFAHVAIIEDVYVRLFLPHMASDRRSADDDDDDEIRDNDPYLLSDGSRIMRLLGEEARTMGIVEILHMKDTFLI